MNYLDLAILGILVVNIALGYAFGMVRRLIVLAGLFAGMAAATFTSASFAGITAQILNTQSVIWSHIVTYGAMVVIIVLIFEVLGASYERWINSFITPLFDRLTGLLAGTLLGSFEVALILIVGVGIVNTVLPPGYAYPPGFYAIQNLYNGSFLAPHFYSLEGLARALFSLVLPGSIGSYFTQLLPH